MGRQFLDEFIKVAIEHIVELIDRHVDAMVGHSALWKIIGANLHAAVAGADLAATGCTEFVHALLLFHLVEPRA